MSVMKSLTWRFRAYKLEECNRKNSIGRPVLPPSALVRPWARKKRTMICDPSLRSYLQDGLDGSEHWLARVVVAKIGYS